MKASKCHSIQKYLKDVPAGAKGRVYKLLKAAEAAGRVGRMNPLRRGRLCDAIFSVENDMESKGAGQSYSPAVLALNAARCHVEADLGWSDR